MEPQLDIDPQNYIVPLLHLLIGLVNKAWVSLVLFFDEFVECISNNEACIKDKIKECETLLSNIEQEMEILTINKNIIYSEMSQNPSQRSELMPAITEMNQHIRQYTDTKKNVSRPEEV